MRDIGLLKSALARPENLFAYGEPNIYKLAASYAYGIAKNHPFIDGNKRTAYVIMELFLLLNGKELIANDDECIKTFLALAAGELSEDDLVKWLQKNCI